jgi:hypothetical protein
MLGYVEEFMGDKNIMQLFRFWITVMFITEGESLLLTQNIYKPIEWICC